MVHRDLIKHRHHYALLLLSEAMLLSLFVTLNDMLLKGVVAVLAGICYFIWGVLTHAGEIRTPKLMLEYASVGLLGTLMLLMVLKTIYIP